MLCTRPCLLRGLILNIPDGLNIPSVWLRNSEYIIIHVTLKCCYVREESTHTNPQL